MGNFENPERKSSLNFGHFWEIPSILFVNLAIILTTSARKSDFKNLQNKSRPREKMSSFEKCSNRFFTFKKNYQNLTFCLLQRDLLHEIDQMFYQNVGVSVWNVILGGWQRTCSSVFRPKISEICPEWECPKMVPDLP